jgi:hypothetical protein
MLRTRGQGRHGTKAARDSDRVGHCQSFYDLPPCPPASPQSPSEDREAVAMMLPCSLVKAISSSSSIVPHHQEVKKKDEAVSAAAAVDSSVRPSTKVPQVQVSTSSRGDAAPFMTGPQGSHHLTAMMMMEQGFCSSNSNNEPAPEEQQERTMEQHGNSSAVVVPRPQQHRYLIARSTLDVVERSFSSSSPAPLLLESAPKGLGYKNHNKNNETPVLAAAASSSSSSSFGSWTETSHYHQHHEDDDVGHLYCYTSPEQQEEGFPFFHPVTPMYNNKPAYHSATSMASWLPVPLSSLENDDSPLLLFGDNDHGQYKADDNDNEMTAY